LIIKPPQQGHILWSYPVITPSLPWLSVLDFDLLQDKPVKKKANKSWKYIFIPGILKMIEGRPGLY